MKKMIAAALITAQALFLCSGKAIAIQPTVKFQAPAVVIDVTVDEAENAAICERVLNGEVFEGIVYNCNSFPSFQTDCNDPERSTADCPGAIPQVVVPVDQELP